MPGVNTRRPRRHRPALRQRPHGGCEQFRWVEGHDGTFTRVGSAAFPDVSPDRGDGVADVPLGVDDPEKTVDMPAPVARVCGVDAQFRRPEIVLLRSTPDEARAARRFSEVAAHIKVLDPVAAAEVVLGATLDEGGEQEPCRDVGVTVLIEEPGTIAAGNQGQTT